MKIGVLKEPETENRVSLLPEHISRLPGKNNQFLIEQSAGNRSFISDQEYKEAGASVMTKEKLIKEADILLKIHISEKDVEEIPSEKIVVSFVNPLVNQSLVNKLVKKNLTVFSLDVLPRTTRAQSMDVLSSMATVAGYKAVIDAAGYLPSFFHMFMSAAGTIRPAKLLILGAGVAGLQAVAIARKLGAVVEVFDVRSAVKEEVQSLGGKFIEVEGAKEEASAGGYAVEQTEDFQQKQQQLIHDHAVKSNVVITTAQIPGRKAPLLLRKDTVKQMIPGSVVIDLAASSGGNCELTKNNKVVEENHVKIIGKSDYPSDMPVDASRMYGNNLINFIRILLNDNNELELNFEDDLVQGTCISHQGKIVSERVKSFIK